MRTTRTVLALALLATAALAAEPAFAWHRTRVGVGFYFGVPVAGWGYYYPPPYYYYPPYYPHYYTPYYPPTTVVVPAQPNVYVEQQAPQAAPQAAPQPAQGFWYYCADSRAYYPYVRDCPGGWQRVSPQPPS